MKPTRKYRIAAVCCLMVFAALLAGLIVGHDSGVEEEQEANVAALADREVQPPPRVWPGAIKRPSSEDKFNGDDETEGVPPDAGPSISEQMELARATVFNFTCSCCGNHLVYAKTLAEHGLSWPKVWDDLSDEVAFHNLRFREEQAIMRIPTDPLGAVKFMREQIRLERAKLKTRTARAPWDESRSDGGAGDLGRFTEMLSNLAPRTSEAVILENLDSLTRSEAHMAAVMNHARGANEEVQMRLYARLADERLLQDRPEGGVALASLTSFVSPDGSEPVMSYYEMVDEHFDGSRSQH